MNSASENTRWARAARRRGHLVFSYWCALAVAVGLAMVWSSVLQADRAPRPSDAEVWEFLEREAPRHGVEPGLAYAIVLAESGGDPCAFNRGARGLMQLQPAAWRQVSAAPFREAWDWRENARTGCAYLAWCRAQLGQAGATSAALLAASYRYGPGAVAEAGYKIENLPRPRNAIYRRLFAGDSAPVPPPADATL